MGLFLVGAIFGAKALKAPEITEEITLNILNGPKNGAAYVNISNPNTEKLTLEKIEVAETQSLERVELHDHVTRKDENGNEYMEMVAVPEMEIQPGETLMLAQGAKHIMLMGLKPEFCAFKSLNFTFHFRDVNGNKLQVSKKANTNNSKRCEK